MLKIYVSEAFIEILTLPFSHESELSFLPKYFVFRIIGQLSAHIPSFVLDVPNMMVLCLQNLNYCSSLDFFVHPPTSYPFVDRFVATQALVNSLSITLYQNIEAELLMSVAHLVGNHSSRQIMGRLKWDLNNVATNMDVFPGVSIKILDLCLSVLGSNPTNAIFSDIFGAFSKDLFVLNSLLYFIQPFLKHLYFNKIEYSSQTFWEKLAVLIDRLTVKYLNVLKENTEQASTGGFIALATEVSHTSVLLFSLCPRPLLELSHHIYSFTAFAEPLCDISLYAFSIHSLRFLAELSHEELSYFQKLHSKILRQCVSISQSDLYSESGVNRNTLFAAFDIISIIISKKMFFSELTIAKSFMFKLFQHGNDTFTTSFIWLSFLQPYSTEADLKTILCENHAIFHIPIISTLFSFSPPKFGREHDVMMLVCYSLLKCLLKCTINTPPKPLLFREIFNFLASTTLNIFKSYPCVEPQSLMNHSKNLISTLDLYFGTFQKFNPNFDLSSNFYSIIGFLIDYNLVKPSETDSTIIPFLFQIQQSSQETDRKIALTAFCSTWMSLQFFNSLFKSKSSSAGDVVTKLHNSITESHTHPKVRLMGIFSFFNGALLAIDLLSLNLSSDRNLSSFVLCLASTLITSFDGLIGSVQCVSDTLLSTIVLEQVFSSLVEVITAVSSRILEFCHNYSSKTKTAADLVQLHRLFLNISLSFVLLQRLLTQIPHFVSKIFDILSEFFGFLVTFSDFFQIFDTPLSSFVSSMYAPLQLLLIQLLLSIPDVPSLSGILDNYFCTLVSTTNDELIFQRLILKYFNIFGCAQSVQTQLASPKKSFSPNYLDFAGFSVLSFRDLVLYLDFPRFSTIPLEAHILLPLVQTLLKIESKVIFMIPSFRISFYKLLYQIFDNHKFKLFDDSFNLDDNVNVFSYVLRSLLTCDCKDLQVSTCNLVLDVFKTSSTSFLMFVNSVLFKSRGCLRNSVI
ncbi:hypothetical protein GEMRC1_002355 [Eukaryota sp. GEM-RC1]